jgi:dTDP-4-amino-4,6-dideoxygalactose transaminase
VPDPGPASCAGAARVCRARVTAYPLRGLDPDPADVEVPAGNGEPMAVIAGHPAGWPAQLAPLAERCAAAGTALVEDCRAALGARVEDGSSVGGLGIASVFSLGSGRQAPAGEGGFLLTDDEELAATVRSLRSHAMTSGTWDRHRGHAETYDVVGVGFNYRIDEVRAAMAIASLDGLEEMVAAQREIARRLADDARGLGAGLLGAERLDRASPLAGLLLPPDAAAAAELRSGLAAAGWSPALEGRLVVVPLDPS